MKNVFIIILGLFSFGCSVKQKDESVVLARVNNHVLTVNELERLLPAKNRTNEQLRTFIKSWVNNSLLVDAAQQDGIDKDQKLIDAKNHYYKQLISNAYLEPINAKEVHISNDEIRQAFDKNKASYRRTEAQASVLVFTLDTYNEAQNVRKKLSKRKSGDIRQELIQAFGVQSQLVTRGYLIQELDHAVFSKKKKSLVGPIRAKNKYHIVQILNKYKKGSQIGIEEMYDEIYQQILKEKQLELVSDLLDSLKSNASVFINSNYQ